MKSPGTTAPLPVFDGVSREEVAALTYCRELAQPHVDAIEALVLLDVDPIGQPDQLATEMKGHHFPPETLLPLGSVFEPRFPDMIAMLADNGETERALDAAGDILDSGDNIILATNHGLITDLPIDLGAVNNHLFARGYEGFKTGIVMSNVVKFIGYKPVPDQPPVPITEVLKMPCDRVFSTYARSTTVKESKLSTEVPHLMTDHNGRAIAETRAFLDGGRVLLALAPSGGTDRPDPQTGRLRMGRVGSGTATKILSHEKAHVLSVISWLKDGDLVFEAVDMPERLADPLDSHRIMEAMAARLNQRVKGHEFEYAQEAGARTY